MTEPATPSAGPETAVEHPPFLAHHFDSPKQQFDAGKLGMWIFLMTEILFFGGLFCWYAVYRANHPEVFVYAHQFLDKTLGAINTGVLIFSSLTAAWAVRCAQLNQRRGLIVCVVITIACALAFLGVKYVEYKHKWEDGLLWARLYAPTAEELARHALPAAPGQPPSPDAPRHAGVFFSVYFAMTGLHGIHVIAGIVAFGWILWRDLRGDFGSQYFGPVDYTALYWHLVDMIWIYLFPLLYLIK